MGLALVKEENEPEITFDDFWQAYPRRQNRKVAAESWKRVSPLDRSAILRGIENWKRTEQWLQDGGKYIPLPSTFLKFERWADEVDIGIKVTYCKWRGCTKPATTAFQGSDLCEGHCQARKRGESP